MALGHLIIPLKKLQDRMYHIQRSNQLFQYSWIISNEYIFLTGGICAIC